MRVTTSTTASVTGTAPGLLSFESLPLPPPVSTAVHITSSAPSLLSNNEAVQSLAQSTAAAATVTAMSHREPANHHQQIPTVLHQQKIQIRQNNNNFTGSGTGHERSPSFPSKMDVSSNLSPSVTMSMPMSLVGDPSLHTYGLPLPIPLPVPASLSTSASTLTMTTTPHHYKSHSQSSGHLPTFHQSVQAGPVPVPIPIPVQMDVLENLSNKNKALVSIFGNSHGHTSGGTVLLPVHSPPLPPQNTSIIIQSPDSSSSGSGTGNVRLSLTSSVSTSTTTGLVTTHIGADESSSSNSNSSSSINNQVNILTNNTSNNVDRRLLISTESQTDCTDLSAQQQQQQQQSTSASTATGALIPPPPPRNNREQRKRERRDRRRDFSDRDSHRRRSYRSNANSHNHSHSTGQSQSQNQSQGLSSTVGGGLPSHLPASGRPRGPRRPVPLPSIPGTSSGSGGPPNICASESFTSGNNRHNNSSSNSRSEREHVRRTQSNSNLPSSTSSPPGENVHSTQNTQSNGSQIQNGDAESVNGSSSDLPDLLHSHLPPPPPYSTLPQGCERRVGVGMGVGHLPLVPINSVPMLPVNMVGQLPPPPPPHGAHGHMQIPMQFGSPHQMQVQHQIQNQHQIHPHPPPPPPPNQSILVQPPPGSFPPPPQQPPPPIQYHFTRNPGPGASRRSGRGGRGISYVSEEEPKSCCGMSTSQAVTTRWFIIAIAAIGISCTVAGTALGASYSTGRELLTLALLLIGVGVVLLTLSAVAWRLTAHESGNFCRAMLGFARRGSSRGDFGREPNCRFAGRLAPSHGRPHHPYAAMMYPDFQYRPPPPTYQASMQEYRLRLLLLERSHPTIAPGASAYPSPPCLTMAPPPPPYPPYNPTLRRGGNARHDPDYSRPPSYTSRTSYSHGGDRGGLRRTPSLDPSAGHHGHGQDGHGLDHHNGVLLDSPVPVHSRDPSLLSYLSEQSIQSIGDNVFIVSTHDMAGTVGRTGHGRTGRSRALGNSSTPVVTVMQAVSVGMELGLDMDMATIHSHMYPSGAIEIDDEPEESKRGKDSSNTKDSGELSGELSDKEKESKKDKDSDGDGSVGVKDGNLVRIVQTTDSSQVIGRDSVIVTVSGSNQTLWDQSLQHANILTQPTIHNQNQNQRQQSQQQQQQQVQQQQQQQQQQPPPPSNQSSGQQSQQSQQNRNHNSSQGSQVQILAHL